MVVYSCWDCFNCFALSIILTISKINANSSFYNNIFPFVNDSNLLRINCQFDSMNGAIVNPYIEYFQRIFDEGSAPERLEDFIDCLKFKELMTAIPDFPLLNFENNPTTFSHAFSNLKELYKKIEQYWNEVFDRELQNEEIDLVEIAHHKNQRQIRKIIDLVIQTLVMSSHKDFFVQKILQTSENTQQYFMRLVESTLEQRKTFSPRKQRQQRLYDKMVQLDHQNEHLQSVISDLCEEKAQMDQKYKQLKEKISEKDQELVKVSEAMEEYLQTPKKNKEMGYFDTQQKDNQLIQRLKQKILQMTKDHETQLIGMKQQIQFYEEKMARTQFLQNQIENYKLRFQSSKEALEQFEDLTKKYSQSKLMLLEKGQLIEQYSQKLTVKNIKIQELEQKIIERDLEIERKNIQLWENQNSASKYTFDDQVSNFSAISLHKTLSENCPQITNSQAEFLYDSNKKLREQLERASMLIKQRELELERLRKQSSGHESTISENRKLVAMIDQISEQNQEQKFLLLGCMHELRKKFLRELKPSQNRNKKQQIRKLSSVTGKPLPIQRKRLQA